LKNVKFEGSNPLDNSAVTQAIAEAEATLGDKGRVLTRKSGTEPLIRVMVEGEDAAQNDQLADHICDVIRTVSAQSAA